MTGVLPTTEIITARLTVAGPQHAKLDATQDDPGAPVGPSVMVESAQRAVVVLAARRPGDTAGMETLLAAFPNDGARAFGFFLVSELTMSLLYDATGADAEVLSRDLAPKLAGAFGSGPRWASTPVRR